MPNSPLCFGEAPGKTWLFHCSVSIGVLGRRLPEVFISLRGFGVALSSFTWKGAGTGKLRGSTALPFVFFPASLCFLPRAVLPFFCCQVQPFLNALNLQIFAH